MKFDVLSSVALCHTCEVGGMTLTIDSDVEAIVITKQEESKERQLIVLHGIWIWANLYL